MSKREFEALKRLLEAQKKAITDNEDMFILWRDKYDDAEECVRERTESNEQVLTCFNDTAT